MSNHMINYEALKQEIIENDVTRIDTCTPMNNKAFYDLTEELEMFLLIQRKKIIVPSAVWAELMKHLNSSDAKKQELAAQAVSIICLHRNIYQIEGEDKINEQGTKRSFADKELLLDIMDNKNYCRQLLISSDKNLIEDALSINDQKSYLGKEVTACYLDQYGNCKICKRRNPAEEKESRKVFAVFNKRSAESSADVPNGLSSAFARVALKAAGYTALVSAGVAVGFGLSGIIRK